ncbi:MAG: DUF4065 domain-containing protein [Geminicoccaceae bacterium]|nr:DUF4065 domain-containing protein [Geminicoccaceae bacterium]
MKFGADPTMPVPYEALAIANEFVDTSKNVDHLKLQKLVYCAYGWWLATEGTPPRLMNERPQVWQHGPVFASLYRTLKVFGRAPISEPQSSSPFLPPPRVDEDDDRVRQLLRWIWGRYGHLSSFALSELTHRAGTPWYRIAREHQFRVPLDTEIPDDYIYAEFSALMSGHSDRAVEASRDGVGQRAATA